MVALGEQWWVWSAIGKAWGLERVSDMKGARGWGPGDSLSLWQELPQQQRALPWRVGRRSHGAVQNLCPKLGVGAITLGTLGL